MKRRKLAISFMIAGALLVCGAISLFLYNKWDENRASQAALETANALTVLIDQRTVNSPLDTPEVFDLGDPDAEDSEDVPEDEPDADPMPAVQYLGKSYVGLVTIPALDLTLPVMETWSDEKLKLSPCRYVGDPRDDNMVIMAHNYNKHFGSISLLQYADPIIFTDANGLEYHYAVAEIEVINSTDIQGMIENDYDFTMFTCTYGGQARVAVRCIRTTK